MLIFKLCHSSFCICSSVYFSIDISMHIKNNSCVCLLSSLHLCYYLISPLSNYFQMYVVGSVFSLCH